MNQANPPNTSATPPSVPGEALSYTCSDCRGWAGIQLIPDAESAPKITNPWLVCVSCGPIAVPAGPINGVAVCLDCKEVVDPRHLPRNINLAVGKRPIIQIRLPDPIPLRDGSLMGSVCPEPEKSTAFGCPLCLCRDINADVTVAIQHASVYFDEQFVTQPPARMLHSRKPTKNKVKETVIQRVTCGGCGHGFSEGSLPTQIIINGLYCWKIAIQLGEDIPPLKLNTAGATIEWINQHAESLIAKGQPTAAQCFVGRAIDALETTAKRMHANLEPATTLKRRRYMAAYMLQAVTNLHDRYRGDPETITPTAQGVSS